MALQFETKEQKNYPWKVSLEITPKNERLKPPFNTLMLAFDRTCSLLFKTGMPQGSFYYFPVHWHVLFCFKLKVHMDLRSKWAKAKLFFYYNASNIT